MSEKEQPNPDFEALLEFIRTDRGFDFTGYKRPSLARRIGKRMEAAGVEGFANYQAYLQGTPTEFVDLFNTILINVTAFFRDEVAWDFLREEIVPRLLQAREKERIRVWSTGCASGEEAYSLAMVLAEAMGEENFKRRVKIYATDVDDDALNVGRHAVYTSGQVEPVHEALRERYFESSNGNFAFRKDMRRSVIFGRHDLLQDPPISKIDLLVSRNTLMYFDTQTQVHVLNNFHFALRDDGFLFLGKSEALAASMNLFAAIDLKRRVFAKVPTAVRRARLGALPLGPGEVQGEVDVDGRVREAGFEAGPVAQIVIDRDGVVVSANLQARTFFGLTQRDLGRPFQDLDVSFRPIELRSRIEQASIEGHVVTLREVEWRVGDEVRYVDLQIAPLVSRTGEGLGIGVTFTEVTRFRRLQEALQESKREMETAYEELQSTVEELETTNEELQSTNEELETTNEELQSTNEELETTVEELQSTNEELETMNDELQDRTTELNEVNTFLDAVLGSLEAAVVVLDDELQVDAWNEGARKLWGLMPDETVGRHFLNLDIGLPTEQLRNPIRKALSQEDGRPEHLRLAAVNRRGRSIDCLISLTPLRARGGTNHGVIVMMQATDSDGRS